MSYLAIILAAGKSTRMGGNLKKAFCEIGGEALIIHLLQTILLSKPEKILIVINSDYNDFEKKYISDYLFDKCSFDFVYQENQLGTGDAVKAAINFIDDQFSYEDTIVFCADTPFIMENSIVGILKKLENSKSGVICGFNYEENNQYGRIVLDDEGQIEKIVEYKDYKNDLDIQKISRCNSGIIAVKFQFLKEKIYEIDNNNLAKEYYLFDLLKLTSDNFDYFELDADEAIGVNSFSELEKAEYAWQERQRDYWLRNFVQLIDKKSIYFGFNNKIAPGTKIFQGVVLKKNIEIGSNVEIGHYSIIDNDVVIGDFTKIKPFSYIKSSRIGKECEIGPFSNLNGENIIGNKNIIGNFVEMKRSSIGSENKAKHLSYIGDGQIGDRNNIGAGAIFCNYDGEHKHQTILNDDNLIGANISLIAPLRFGDNNLLAAGSVINNDFDDNNLVIERGEQIVKKRYKNKNK